MLLQSIMAPEDEDPDDVDPEDVEPEDVELEDVDPEEGDPDDEVLAVDPSLEPPPPSFVVCSSRQARTFMAEASNVVLRTIRNGAMGPPANGKREKLLAQIDTSSQI